MKQDLRERIDAVTTTCVRWEPEVGDAIVGTLERYENAATRFGERRVAIIADGEHADMSWRIMLGPAVLQREFAEQNPLPGDRLAVKRLADGRGQRGTFKNYTLIIERAPDMPDVPTDRDDAVPTVSAIAPGTRIDETPTIDLDLPLSHDPSTIDTEVVIDDEDTSLEPA